VMAVASRSTPEYHEGEEAKQYGDDCWRSGVAHFCSLLSVVPERGVQGDSTFRRPRRFRMCALVISKLQKHVYFGFSAYHVSHPKIDLRPSHLLFSFDRTAYKVSGVLLSLFGRSDAKQRVMVLR
jgi:hypothetical protein